jgi:4-hydroxybenzoate polyprenyltransferase
LADEETSVPLPVTAPARPSGFVGKLRMLLELVKFEHSIFALPYAYIGALYGAANPMISRSGTATASSFPTTWITVVNGHALPTWSAVGWITVAMVGARSFAFVVNRAVDKEIDARNPRTAGRAVPAGLIKAWELWLFAAVMLAAFLVAVWQLAPVCRWLWPIVLIAFLVYPYTKRHTSLCHYWLGMCLGLAPVGAWVAVTNDATAWQPYIFGVAVLLWTAGFDIIYALQDVECDIRDGIHSAPADWGIPSALMMARENHAAAAGLLVAAGWVVGAGWPYWVAAFIAGILLAYENSLVRPDDLSRVNAAFFTMNGVIAMVVLAGALADRLIA